MIEATTPDANGFARRLARKARALAAAFAEARLRERRGDAARWRRPALLWPLFTRTH
jgi:hypothetical protein